MYEFSGEEKNILKQIGQTGHGRDLMDLMTHIRRKINTVSDIPTGGDYGSQVEGRKLASAIFKSIIDNMQKSSNAGFGKSNTQTGSDEYD